MKSVPADESSSNRESVFRSKAIFSIPLVGVLKKKVEDTHIEKREGKKKKTLQKNPSYLALSILICSDLTLVQSRRD